MTPTDPALNSPKRKRSSIVRKVSPSQLNTNVTPLSPPEEETECGSPRTNVAHQFQGLELQGGTIGKLDLKGPSRVDGVAAEENLTRKRIKILNSEEPEIPETPEGGDSRSSSVLVSDAVGQGFSSMFRIEDDLKPVVFKGLSAHSNSSAARLARAYPSINRLADSKSRGRKRMGTPPLSANTDPALVDVEDLVVDPDRAALTWHDDEITGHDPNDPEDDGEGINGIGFKPTPAEARARTERRRQQMAEYKSREMKEARAKRSERRRGGASMAAGSKEDAARRVRFSEAEANVMITTASSR